MQSQLASRHRQGQQTIGMHSRTPNIDLHGVSSLGDASFATDGSSNQMKQRPGQGQCMRKPRLSVASQNEYAQPLLATTTVDFSNLEGLTRATITTPGSSCRVPPSAVSYPSYGRRLSQAPPNPGRDQETMTPPAFAALPQGYLPEKRVGTTVPVATRRLQPGPDLAAVLNRSELGKRVARSRQRAQSQVNSEPADAFPRQQIRIGSQVIDVQAGPVTSAARLRSHSRLAGGQAAQQTRGLLASIGGVPLHPKLAAHIEQAAGLHALPDADAAQATLLRHLEGKLRWKLPYATSPKKIDPLVFKRAKMAKRLADNAPLQVLKEASEQHSQLSGTEHAADEDSEHDYLLVMRRTGKKAEPRPNRPTTLHTWRTVDKVVDQYSQKLADRGAFGKRALSLDQGPAPQQQAKRPFLLKDHSSQGQGRSAFSPRSSSISPASKVPKMSPAFMKYLEEAKVDRSSYDELSATLRSFGRNAQEASFQPSTAVTSTLQATAPERSLLSGNSSFRPHLTLTPAFKQGEGSTATSPSMLSPETTGRTTFNDARAVNASAAVRLPANRSAMVSGRTQQPQQPWRPAKKGPPIRVASVEVGTDGARGPEESREPPSSAGSHRGSHPASAAGTSGAGSQQRLEPAATAEPKGEEVPDYAEADAFQKKWAKALYNKSSMITSARRTRVMLRQIMQVSQMQKRTIKGLKTDAPRNRNYANVMVMVGAHLKSVIGKRDSEKKALQAELESVSEGNIKLECIQRALNMGSYVQNLEDLLNAHPLSKSGLVNAKCSPADIDSLPGQAAVALARLADVNSKIQVYLKREADKLQAVKDQYGSLEAFRQHVETLEKKASEDYAEYLKEKEKQKKFREAKERAKNKKGSLEDRLRTTRWMSNYENTVKEILQDEIDVFQELENEERLAALVLMQDEIVEQVLKLDCQKLELQELIEEVKKDTNKIKRQLQDRNKVRRQHRVKFRPGQTLQAKSGSSEDSSDNELNQSHCEGSEDQGMETVFAIRRRKGMQRRLGADASPDKVEDSKENLFEDDSDSIKTEFSNLTLKELADKTLTPEKRNKKKDRRAMFRTDMHQMNRELEVVHERFGEDGLDAIMTPLGKGKAQSFKFSNDAQLETDLFSLFNKQNSGMKFDQDEISDNEEENKTPGSFKSKKSSSVILEEKGKDELISGGVKPKPVEVFEDLCQQTFDKAPSIFRKMQKGRFELSEKTLTEGQVLALSEAATHFDNFIDQVKFENNNLSDEDLSTLVKKLSVLPNLKQLNITQNDIGEKTLSSLRLMLNKKIPYNLKELSIDKIKMKPADIKQLMQILTFASLRRLSLVQLNITDEHSFKIFLDYLKVCSLEDFDVRSSKVSVGQFMQLLDILKHNKKLKYLNLSDNNLVMPVKKLADGKEDIAPESQFGLSSQQYFVVYCLTRLIKCNKKLIHLNLENTGLTCGMIKELLITVKQSRGLQGLHLCNNPGCYDQSLFYYAIELLNPINFSPWADARGGTPKQQNSHFKIKPLNSGETTSQDGGDQVEQAPKLQRSGAQTKQKESRSRPRSRGQIRSRSRRRSDSRLSKNLKANSTKSIASQIEQNRKSRDKDVDSSINREEDDELSTIKPHDPYSSTSKFGGSEQPFPISRGLTQRANLPTGLEGLQIRDTSRVGVYEQERKNALLHTYKQEKEAIQYLGTKKFILTKFTGHKKTMANGERWRLYVQQQQGKPGCWICDKYIYTLFFWTRAFGMRDKPTMESYKRAEFEEKAKALAVFRPGMPINPDIHETNNPSAQDNGNIVNSPASPFFGGNDSYLQQHQFEAPVLTGSFNDWEEPQQMMPVRDFTAFVDKRKAEYIQMLQKEEKINKDAQKYVDLTPKERQIYQKGLPHYVESYMPERWKEIVTRKLLYRRPGLVNAFDPDTMLQPQVFVTAAFVKPGNHQYVVGDLRHPDHQLISIHNMTVESRTEEIMSYERVVKQKKGGNFNRMRSIFAPWPAENDELFRRCIEHDFNFWKVPRIIKDPQDYEKTKSVLLKHAKLVQQIFQYISAKGSAGSSSYPTIGWMDFSDFCKESHISTVENKFQKAADLCYISATTVSVEAQQAKKKSLKGATKTELLKLSPDNNLQRYQFVEVLVRIAAQKYLNKNLIATNAQALEQLFQENILGYYFYETAEQFRVNELWTKSVADLFKTNEQVLLKLFKKFHHGQKNMSPDSAYAMVEKVNKVEGPQTGMSLKDFAYIYAMSKQVVVSESEQGLQYLRTKFLEMVEMIARTAVYKFDDSDMENLPLDQKISLLLDELFALIKMHRATDEAESDDSVSSGESEDEY